MGERLELAQALADKRGAGRLDVKAWRPLLDFTRGNPLTVTVVVGQALKDGLKTTTQIDGVPSAVAGRDGGVRRRGERGARPFAGRVAALRVRARVRRRRSAACWRCCTCSRASWTWTCWLDGRPGGGLAACRNCAGGRARTCIPLLDRAAEVGLLTPHGGGYYGIHPAVPWFFRDLFAQHYPEAPGSGSPVTSPPSTRATRAYVEAMGELGNYYCQQFDGRQSGRDRRALRRGGQPAARPAAGAGARLAARRSSSAMQGLRSALRPGRPPRRVAGAGGGDRRPSSWTRRRTARAPGWRSSGAGHEVPRAAGTEARRWDEAERLQRATDVEWNRRAAAAALATPAESLDAAGRNRVRTLAVSLEQLGRSCASRARRSALAHTRRATSSRYASATGRRRRSPPSTWASAYMDIPALRDLDAAERWYQRSLELTRPARRAKPGQDAGPARAGGLRAVQGGAGGGRRGGGAAAAAERRGGALPRAARS